MFLKETSLENKKMPKNIKTAETKSKTINITALLLVRIFLL
jgi:hypothetical protein